MTIDALVKLTLRYLATIAICLALSVVCSIALYFSKTPIYQGQTTAYVTAGEGGSQGAAGEYSNTLLAQMKLKSFMPLFTSDAVAHRVIVALNLNLSPGALASSISVENPPDTVTVRIFAKAKSPQEAQAIADAVVPAVGEEIKRLEPSSTTRVDKVSSAAISSTPVSPSKKRYFGGGVILGLILGYLVAMVRAHYDTRIRTSADIEERLKKAVLGVLPDSEGIRSLDFTLFEDFRAREAVRKARTNLRYANLDEGIRSLVITSATQGEGKSSTASFLAAAIAESGENVLLIDADLRRPTIGERFDVDESAGLTQVLAGMVPIERAIQDGPVTGMKVLPAGELPANPSEVLGSQRMRELVSFLETDYFVILDAPPILPVTDAALLGRVCDGVCLVVGSGQVTYKQVGDTIKSIESVGGKVLGLLLNRASIRFFSRLSYGDAEFGYGKMNSRYEEYKTKNNTDKATGVIVHRSTPADASHPGGLLSVAHHSPATVKSAPAATEDHTIKGCIQGQSSTRTKRGFPSRREWLSAQQNNTGDK